MPSNFKKKKLKPILHIKFDVGEEPTVCDHCGSENMERIGLVAPRCGDCNKFSISHMTPRVVQNGQ
jgi:hypothetical protein